MRTLYERLRDLLPESGVRAGATDETGRDLQSLASEFLCHQHVGEMLDLYDVNCVFDVGANTGQYGRELRELGYTGRIVSFEPASAAFERLAEAAAGDPEWRVYRLALGREEGVTAIHTGWDTMNSLLPPSDYGRGRYERFTETRTEEVRVRRLADVMDEALDCIDDPRPFLKMDTQGYDLEVFTGAGKRIDEFVGMQSEVACVPIYDGMPRFPDQWQRYEDAGFEAVGLYPVSFDPSTMRAIEFDLVMVRPEAVRRR